MDCANCYDRYELELRLQAIVSLLHDAERSGLRISKEAQDAIENECEMIFEHDDTPMDEAGFAALLKDTAVRMFRQRRYDEADARYRMASLFNAEDATLISNRATCMYNLKNFERCVDVCYACLMRFPTLCFQNTKLYLKLIVRLGHANIELTNYKSASKIYRGLLNFRNHLKDKCGLSIENEEFDAVATPLRRHLNEALDAYHTRNPGKPLRDPRKRETPYELGLDGYLHMNFEESMEMSAEEFVADILFFDEENDGEEEGADKRHDTDETIDLHDLCCHVWSSGTAPCQHAFPEEHENFVNTDDVERTNGEANEHSGCILCGVHTGEEEQEEELSGTDDDMPGLLSDVEDDDETDDYDENQSESDGEDKSDMHDINGPRAQPVQGVKALQASGGRKNDTQGSQVTTRSLSGAGSSSSPSETLEGDFTKTTSLRMGFTGKKQPVQKTKSMTQAKGFKKGFLDNTAEESEKAGFDKKLSSVLPSPGVDLTTAASKKGTNVVALYETDDEDGPAEGSRSLGAIEDAVSSARKSFPLLQDDAIEHLPRLTRDIFGEKYNSSSPVDAIDFTALFGEHLRQVKSGKKKKRSCDKKCGPCFARKLWRLRFTNRSIDDVECFLDDLDRDPRRDQSTYLGQEQWQSIGYFGSGYELTFDVPAVVHGVAYIALVQSELQWRGDIWNPERDVQQTFLNAIEKNLTTSLTGMNYLFMIIFMLRDTITLFDVLSDRKSRGLTYSFQFARTASEVAKNLRQNSDSRTGALSERQANLMTRSDDCVQNVHNWSLLGHVEKEEVWVYKILLKNATDLLLNVTSRVSTSLRPSERTETFTEAFRRLRGDRHDDESLWKHRVVSAMCKQRCRALERSSISRKAVDLSRCAILLTRAMKVRPNQPRLFYKRADIFAHQERWGDCVRDLQKARILLGEQITVKQSVTLLDPAQRLLLLHIYTLEGDAYSAQGRKPGRDQRTCIRKGIDFISKALEVNPKSKRTKMTLQKKLRALQSLEKDLTSVGSQAFQISQGGPYGDQAEASNRTAETERSADTTTARESSYEPSISPDEIDHEASSDEEADDHVVGNPYAVLLGTGLSLPSQTAARPNHAGSAGSCELCDVEFWSQADYTSHMNGKRHKSMVNKARQRGLIPQADGTYSAPGSRLGPTRNEIVQQASRILASQGGYAKSSEILNRLNFRRWKIRDAGDYLEKTFGGILPVCATRSDIFQVGAGSSVDPVLRLKNGSASISRRSQPNGRDDPTARRANVKQGPRLSETGDFSQMVSDLLRIDSSRETGQEPEVEECGICLDNEPDVRCWPCGHTWCDVCMELYMAKKGTKKGVECPKCRGTIESVHRIAVD